MDEIMEPFMNLNHEVQRLKKEKAKLILALATYADEDNWTAEMRPSMKITNMTKEPDQPWLLAQEAIQDVK